jgi:hypothetical protein
MRRARLARLFWIGAAAILVVAALIAVAAVLTGGFSETDGKILATLGSILLAGATAIAGLSLIERRQLVPLGWVAVGGAVVGFALLEASIWHGFEGRTINRMAGTALFVLIELLLATTGWILLRGRRPIPLYGAMLIVLSVAVLLTVVAIWSGADSSGMGKAIATFWILAVLGWLLVPVLQRFSNVDAEAAPVRILAELDDVELVASRGPVEGIGVDTPSTGERLFLRRRY